MAENQPENLSEMSQNTSTASQQSELLLPQGPQQQHDQSSTSSIVFSDESQYDLSGFSNECLEIKDPFDSIFYRVMPSRESTIIRFYTKPIFNNIISVLDKEFKVSENSSRKFSVKTHAERKRCTIHVDKTDLTISLTGPGQVKWRENSFRKITVNMFNNIASATQTVLNASSEGRSVSMSGSDNKD